MKNLLLLQSLPRHFIAVIIAGAICLGCKTQAAETYSAGAKIEVQWAGDNKWYKAEIVEFKDGYYKVRYDADGLNAFYKEDRMRPLPGAAQPKPQATSADGRDVATQTLFNLLDSSKNGYLSGTEITPEVKKYDSNGDGRIPFEEFALSRANANGEQGRAAPIPPNETTDTIKPIGKVAGAKLPELPPLKAKPGTIIGRAVFADGRPMPKFEVSAGGWAGEIHMGPGGTIPSLGQVMGQKGVYEIQPTSAFDRTKLLKEAAVVTVYSDALFSYNNREYRLTMHPMDGKLDGSGEGHFKGKTSVGVIRDFVLKMNGPKRGYEINPPPTDTGTNEMSDPSFGAFYGGTFWLDLDPRQGNQADMAGLKGSKVTVTLSPTGTLMDGSAAQVVTRSMTIQQESSVGQSFYFRDVPLGDYTATASITKPGAAAFPLRLRILGGEWQKSAPVVFTPTTSGYTQVAHILSTR